jgi:hypothetical protein
MCAAAAAKVDEEAEVPVAEEDDDTDDGKSDKPNGSGPADAEHGEIVDDEIDSSSKPITASSSGKGGKDGKGKGGGAGGNRDNDADQGGNSDNDGNGTEVTLAESGQDAGVGTGLRETDETAAPKSPEADPAKDKETQKRGASGASKQPSTKPKGGSGGRTTRAQRN